MRAESGAIAPLIAVIGCDGSGKSTVSEHILAYVARYGPASAVHLGKQSGNVGRAIEKLPVFGKSMDRVIRKKTDKSNKRLQADMQPSLLPALVIAGFTLRRRRRFNRMLELRRKGEIIVTDRYPQVAVPGAYDGPGFPATTKGSAFVLWLGRWERSVFEWMATYKPDLVLRLNVDLDVACARKPDHRREALRKKIEVTPLLSYGGAPIVDIDTNQSLDQVLKEAEAAVAKIMTARGYKAS